MRHAIAAVSAALVLGAPAVARACSGYCGDDARFFLLFAETETPVPRDGALVVYGGSGDELCFAELASHVTFMVKHGGAPVPGHVEVPGGTGLFVFVPDDPWLPAAEYTASVMIDNAGIGPGSEEWCGYTEDVVSTEFAFTTAAEFSPPLPSLPPPAFTTWTWPIDDDFSTIACCPAVIPESDDSAGCDPLIQWFGGSCAYLFAETSLRVTLGEFMVPAALRGQVLYELYLDGALVRRTTDLEVAADRSAATCASIRAIHLGTRRSPVSKQDSAAPPGAVAEVYERGILSPECHDEVEPRVEVQIGQGQVPGIARGDDSRGR